MSLKPKFVIGIAVVALAIAYMIYAGVTQSAVYFITPSELAASPLPGKAYRLGGMVEKGSVKWTPATLDLAFRISDGQRSLAVRHHGTPPDLFGEGRGAVVEGKWNTAGYFEATQILAKHSEEYKAPPDGAKPGYQELMKSLRGADR
jgi:cytochrome c-type biogenesis protein CcmE